MEYNFNKNEYKKIIKTTQEISMIKMFITIILYGIIAIVISSVNETFKIIEIEKITIIIIGIILGVIKALSLGIKTDK